ncbi:type 1 periplasmic binding fold superfamily protein [Lewinella sp. IMCC34183]|uniref:type 1 periplasmic binding fold superfamily protein n=1 Tax=Lewinella sp. IMCC34183 TaxID=2248762 RepID=UPI000E26B39F|nr:type 1 periplasmic binding fold superfamily protein [Lewinella sp. IMCC34183]
MARLLSLLPLLLLLFTSCGDKDDPVIENEEEVITDLVYVLTPVDNGETVTFRFSDPDGDGPEMATTDITGDLMANTSYLGTLSLTNASDPSDPEDITAEISAEDEDHQFFFVPSGGLDVTVAYADSDNDGNPVGLLTEMETGAVSSGGLQIILRHEPNKAAGATISDPTGAGGETDIAVTFPVSVGN